MMEIVHFESSRTVAVNLIQQGSGCKTNIVYDDFYTTATVINGTKIAEDIKREVAAEVETLKNRSRRPGLAVVLV